MGRVVRSKRQQIVAEVLVLVGAAHQAAILQGGDQPVLDLRQGAAVDVGHREQEAVAADFFHDLAHAGGNRIAGAAQLVMGKLDAIPAAVVRGLDLMGDGRARELVMPRERDLFR